MSFRQAFFFDLALIILPFLLAIRLPFWYAELQEQATVEVRVQSKKEAEQRTAKVSTQAIVDADYFRVKPPEKPSEPPPEVEPVAKPKPAPPPPPPPPVVTLPLELKGTIVDSETSVAFILNTRDRKTGVHGIGEEIIPGVRLMQVHVHRVVLDNRGNRQELIEAGYEDQLKKLLGGSMKPKSQTARKAPPKKGGLPKPSGNYEVVQQDNNVYVTRAEVKRQVQNLSSLLSQVRVQPNITASGRANGFKVLHVNSGSFIEAVGVRSGDIIREINGEVVDSMARGYSIFNKVRNDTSLDVKVERNGSLMDLRYEMRY